MRRIVFIGEGWGEVTGDDDNSNYKPLMHWFSHTSSSSRMRVINHNWSATKQRPHPQSVAEISRHSVLSGDRI